MLLPCGKKFRKATSMATITKEDLQKYILDNSHLYEDSKSNLSSKVKTLYICLSGGFLVGYKGEDHQWVHSEDDAVEVYNAL